MTRKKTPAKAL